MQNDNWARKKMAHFANFKLEDTSQVHTSCLFSSALDSFKCSIYSWQDINGIFVITTLVFMYSMLRQSKKSNVKRKWMPNKPINSECVALLSGCYSFAIFSHTCVWRSLVKSLELIRAGDSNKCVLNDWLMNSGDIRAYVKILWEYAHLLDVNEKLWFATFRTILELF